MYTRISDIIFKELIPMSVKKTGLNMLFYYFSQWRERRRAEREEAEQNQGGRK